MTGDTTDVPGEQTLCFEVRDREVEAYKLPVEGDGSEEGNS